MAWLWEWGGGGGWSSPSMSFSEALNLEAGERADPGNSHCFLLPLVKVFNIFWKCSPLILGKERN